MQEVEIERKESLVDEGTSSTSSHDDSKKLIKVKSHRRMLQLQRTRPKQSRTKDHNKLQHHLQRRMKNLPGMFIYLMVIAFYLLTMDIWIGIVKFLTSTIIIYKTLEASLQDHETGSTMILSEENMC